MSEPPSNATDLNRLYAFSDGVFAIAITLLAFEVKIPDLAPQQFRTEFFSILAGMAPQMLAFLQSFFMVGIYWIIHHRIFRLIVRYDSGLLWLNMLYLLSIAFLPIPSKMLIQYFIEPLAMLFYLAALAVTGLANLGLWLYASRRGRLVAPDLDSKTIQQTTRRAMVVPLAVLAALALFALWPYAIYTFPYLMMGGFFFVERLARRK